MDIPSPERRRVKITTDTRPSSISKLASTLAHVHPFTQQIDLIFPTPAVKEDAFVGLNTRYYRAKVSLSDAIAEGGPFGELFLNSDRCFSMLSVDDHSDDVWCIDHRGVLTISVPKVTYERLGLVGKKLPFKGHEEQYVISVNLRDKNSETIGNRARRIEVLKSWDKRREQEGHGDTRWTVLFNVTTDDLDPSFVLKLAGTSHEVAAQVTRTTDVHIPSPKVVSLPPEPTGSSAAEDDGEDWNADIAALFEWVGMAGLGSQRLKANDRVDSFVALYECPSPSYVGNLTHVRWTGFLSPNFIQSIINNSIRAVGTQTGPSGSEHRPLFGLVSQSITATPVAYIPLEGQDGAPRDSPMRLPRGNGEDTWSLILTPGLLSSSVDWVLAESVGQYDLRWG